MATAIELGRKLEQKRGELESFLKSRQTENGLDFRGDDLATFNHRNDELKSLADSYAAARSGEASMKSMSRSGVYGAGGQGAAVKSVGQQFVESREYKTHASEGQNARFGVDIEASLKTVFAAGTGYVPYPPLQPGAIPFAQRRLVVADLLPQTDTDVPSVIYMEQSSPTFGAAPVAEGASKPASTLGWTRQSVPLEVIAHHLPITNQALEDIPGIRDIIDQQMIYGLQLAEENQLLSGSGESPHLQGFLTKSGIQTQAKGSDDPFTATMKAFTKIRFTGFADVTGGVMHPNDWQEIATTKDDQGRFIYGDPFSTSQNPRLWGVPIVITPAIPEGTALFGDFLMYSRLWRKGGVRVIVGHVNDDLIRNQQTLVVEERVALQVARGSAFAKLTGL